MNEETRVWQDENGDYVEGFFEKMYSTARWTFVYYDLNSEIARMQRANTHIAQTFDLYVFASGQAIFVDDNDAQTESYAVEYDENEFDYVEGCGKNLQEIFDKYISGLVKTQAEYDAEYKAEVAAQELLRDEVDY